jgi:diguanylate cyclase (GGDEF)-like protein
MTSLAQTMLDQIERIIADWQEWLERNGTKVAEPEAFSQVARPALAELAARVDELLGPDGETAGPARWWPQSPLMPAVRAYAASRRAAGAEASLIAREWQLLRAALWQALAAEFSAAPAARQMELQVALNYAFDDALAQTIVAQQLFELRIANERNHAAERAAFNKQLAIEVERAARYSRPCSLSILDIDQLRRVNEKLGRKRGDRLVKDLESLLHSQLRQTDRAFRYGGDEFVAILPETDFDSASAVMSRIGERATRLCRELRLPPEVGIHWGIASFPQDAEEAKTLFLLADNRLREHKREAANKGTGPTQQASAATVRLD